MTFTGHPWLEHPVLLCHLWKADVRYDEVEMRCEASGDTLAALAVEDPATLAHLDQLDRTKLAKLL